MSRINKPCPKCGHNRWRTVIKGRKWRCRGCGYEREKEGRKRAMEAQK